jgi:phosphopantetheinyl transferase (holo-ACP synthase)
MTSHLRPQAHDAIEASFTVAFLDGRCLAGADQNYSLYLSDKEKARFRSLGHAGYRLGWLAGRLAAKHLFLRKLETHMAHAAMGSGPVMIQLSVDMINKYTYRMYREIEVSTSTATLAAGPRFQWRGWGKEDAVSLSHKGHDACACLSDGSTVGVDIESVEPRIDAFRRTHFTAAETRWVQDASAVTPLNADWFYTLLWSIKEAALKARATVQKSPVSFGGIEVAGLPAPQQALSAHSHRAWGDRFTQFTARIQDERKSSAVRVAFMGTSRQLLAVVQPLTSAQRTHAAVMS